jgi:thiamine pyrophosphate-dependent acetolactate synthase large subunit-like protein
MAISGGELLLDLFEACGIEYIFCSPGTEWTPLWEGLLKRRGQGDNSLKYINCRHEILAISAAQGYAEATGRLSAVLLHSSVGPLLGAMAMRNAWSACAPMLIFSGETTEHCGDAEVKAQGWQWLGLLSDIGGPSALVEKYVKWVNGVKSREGLVDSVIRGSRIALSAPRGPVYISVPTEILLKSGAEMKIARPFPSAVLLKPADRDLHEIARQFVASRHPVIIAEHAGRRPGAVARLVELAELLSIPVFDNILHFSSNFPKDNPLYMGLSISEALKEADTVFVVASSVPWYPPAAGPAANARIIVLDENTRYERLPYWGYRADLTINADVEAALAALVKIVRAEKARQKSPDKFYTDRLAHWRQKHEDMTAEMDKEALAVRANKPIAARWFCHAAQKAFPADAIILDETILYTHLIHQYLAEPGRYIKPAYGGLGVGMGAALGVKLAKPDRPVILIVGDGAFNYNPVLAGLGLAQEYRLPVFIIVLNNGGYMAMKRGHRRLYPQGWAASHDTYLGVDIAPAPDYVKVAEAFGAYGEKLEEPGKIEAALKRGLRQIAGGKTALLDVIVDVSL